MNDEMIKLREWLILNDVFIIAAIAKKAVIPKGEMYHFLKDRRELPQKHYINLISVLVRYGYNPVNTN